MAYETHTTDGFVLGGVNTGEAHRYIFLYTSELGLVKGVARSVREERSKLRYGLQDFSFSTFRLVRGRDVWRIVGADVCFNAYYDCASDREKIVILSNTFMLVRRLVAGEERNKMLYAALQDGVLFLRNNTITLNELKNFEHLFVLRILHALGYIRKTDRFDEFLHVPTLTAEYLATLSPFRKEIAVEINHALRESHL